MRFVTPIDRLIQAGGSGVTAAFWILAVAGALAYALTDLPTVLSFSIAGVATTIYWMRWQHITIVDLLSRIAYTRVRHR